MSNKTSKERKNSAQTELSTNTNTRTRAATGKMPILWTRGFIVVSLANFLNSIVFLLLLVVMSKIATDRFGASSAMAGLSASIFLIGAFIVRPLLGKWIHRLGQVKTLYAGSILSLVLTLAYFAAGNIGLLLLIRFLHGATYSMASMARGTIVAGVLPSERYGEGIGYFTLGETLSMAIGPSLGMVLLQHGGFHAIIIVCAAITAVALVILPLMQVKDLELTPEQAAETKGFKLSNYLEPKAVFAGLAIMLSFVCYSAVSSFLALYSEQIHLTAAAGAFFIVYAVAILVTRPAIGRWFDYKGPDSVMYPAILILAVSLLVLALAHHLLTLLVAAALLGLGFGTVQSCGRALIISTAPLHRMGQATSTFYIFGDSGQGIGPLVCGLLIPLTGYRLMYGIMAVVALASLWFYRMHANQTGEGLPPLHK